LSDPEWPDFILPFSAAKIRKLQASISLGFITIWWGITDVCGGYVFIDDRHMTKDITMMRCECETPSIGALSGGKHTHVNVTYGGGSILVRVQKWAGP